MRKGVQLAVVVIALTGLLFLNMVALLPQAQSEQPGTAQPGATLKIGILTQQNPPVCACPHSPGTCICKILDIY